MILLITITNISIKIFEFDNHFNGKFIAIKNFQTYYYATII